MFRHRRRASLDFLQQRIARLEEEVVEEDASPVRLEAVRAPPSSNIVLADPDDDHAAAAELAAQQGTFMIHHCLSLH